MAALQGTSADARRSALIDTIADYLLSKEPRMVVRLDASALLETPGFWDNVSHYQFPLGAALQRRDPQCSAWHLLGPGIKALVLGSQVGEVIAFGKANDEPEHIAFLLVLPDGLGYHPALTQEQIAAARAYADQDEATAARALESELELFGFLVGHIASPCEIDAQDERLLNEIRQILWELKVRTWSLTERFVRLAQVQALFTTIAKNSGYELEDVLSDGRRAFDLI